MGTGVRLAVDIAALTTAAAISRDGRRSPVVFGDSLIMATPTAANGPGRDTDLLHAVETVRGDDHSVVQALAEHLRTVAGYAGGHHALAVVVPPSWGRRHHDRVVRAASAASLAQPRILSEAAAIAEHTFAAAADGATVVVCVLGQRSSHATVVQRHAGAWIRVATQAIPAATGDHIDQRVAEAIGADAGVGTEGDLLSQIAGVRSRLVAGQPTAVVVPGHPVPLPVAPDEFARAARAARDAAITAVLDVLDAAAVDPDQLHGVVVAGDFAAMLAVADALGERLARPVTTAADGRLAAAYGALATPPGGPLPADDRAPRRWWGLRWVQLVMPIVAAGAAALLQWQIFDVVDFMLGPQIRRLSDDYQMLSVAFDTAAFALVGWCLTAASLEVARSLAVLAREDDSDDSGHRDRWAGQVYAFAAVVGLALASLQGLLAQAIIGGPPQLAPPYLVASIAGAALPALVAIGAGLASRWLTATPPWMQRLHHPLTAVVLAAAGVLASNARSSRLPIAGLPHLATTILGVTGGGLLGVAIAFTVVTARPARIILGVLLGTACMIIVGFANLHGTIVIYLAAVALWWIRRASRIAADNLPRHWWRRLAGADNTTDPSA